MPRTEEESQKQRRTGSSPPLHIAFYSPELPSADHTNGIVTYTQIMRDALRDLGQTVTIVTTEQVEYANGEVIAVPHGPAWMRGIKSLIEFVRAKDGSHPSVRARIIDAFNTARRAGAQICEMEESFGWAGRVSGLPVVVRLHGPHCFLDGIDEHDVRRPQAELQALSKVAAVTAPSTRLLNDTLSLANARPRFTRRIFNPMRLPTEHWSATGSEQILCVGRLDVRKGADIAYRAFLKALEVRPTLNLVMVGPGSMEFPAHDRVKLMGEQPPSVIHRLRMQSGLSLTTSRFETFCYAAVEAMALGMPVVVPDTYGIGELVRDGVNGRVIQIGNIDGFADAIVQTLNDSKLGTNGRKTVAELLSPERIASETLELYRRVLARR